MGLIGVGVEYLRFFSFKQLISDGLTLLIPLLLVILLALAVLLPFAQYVNNILLIAKNKIESLETKKINILNGLILIIILLMIYYCFYIIKTFVNINDPLTYLIVFLSVFYLPFFYFSGQIIKFIEDNFIEFNLRYFDYLKQPFYATKVISLYCFFYFVIKGVFWLNVYSFPDNFINIEHLNSRIANEYGIDKNKYEISYMNDNYIFIEAVLLDDIQIKKLRDNDEKYQKRSLCINLRNYLRLIKSNIIENKKS